MSKTFPPVLKHRTDRPRQLSQYSKSLRAGRSGDRIPVGGGRNFPCRPERPVGSPSLSYNTYRVFPPVKRPEIGAEHPPPSSDGLRIGWKYTCTSISPLCLHKACHRMNFNFGLHFPEFKFIYHCSISYLMTKSYQNYT